MPAAVAHAPLFPPNYAQQVAQREDESDGLRNAYSGGNSMGFLLANFTWSLYLIMNWNKIEVCSLVTRSHF